MIITTQVSENYLPWVAYEGQELICIVSNAIVDGWALFLIDDNFSPSGANVQPNYGGLFQTGITQINVPNDYPNQGELVDNVWLIDSTVGSFGIYKYWELAAVDVNTTQGYNCYLSSFEILNGTATEGTIDTDPVYGYTSTIDLSMRKVSDCRNMTSWVDNGAAYDNYRCNFNTVLDASNAKSFEELLKFDMQVNLTDLQGFYPFTPAYDYSSGIDVSVANHGNVKSMDSLNKLYSCDLDIIPNGGGEYTAGRCLDNIGLASTSGDIAVQSVSCDQLSYTAAGGIVDYLRSTTVEMDKVYFDGTITINDISHNSTGIRINYTENASGNLTNDLIFAIVVYFNFYNNTIEITRLGDNPVSSSDDITETLPYTFSDGDTFRVEITAGLGLQTYAKVYDTENVLLLSYYEYISRPVGLSGEGADISFVYASGGAGGRCDNDLVDATLMYFDDTSGWKVAASEISDCYRTSEMWTLDSGILLPYPKSKFTPVINNRRGADLLSGTVYDAQNTTCLYGEVVAVKVELDEDTARRLIQHLISTRGSEMNSVFPAGYYPFGRRYNGHTNLQTILYSNSIDCTHDSFRRYTVTFQLQLVSVA